MIGFGAEGIDFSTHFLSDKAKLFSLSLRENIFTAKSLAEVIEMCSQTLFFFIDIKLLDIEYKLLFKTSRIIFYRCQPCELILKSALIFGTLSFS